MAAERRPASSSCVSSSCIRKRCNASSVATPIAAQTTASRATSVTSKRTRSDQVRGDQNRVPGSACGFEDIPGAPQCVDHRVPATVDLLAQVRHIQFNDVRPPPEVVTPHPVEDLGLAQYPLGIAHHEPQQFE